jgi:hypothetical protein
VTNAPRRGAPGRPPSVETSVGIFWQVPDAAGLPHLLVDSEPLGRTELYGDFFTHSRGHHEVWTDWQRRGSRFLRARGWPLSVLTHEYEDFPRGRVVYHFPTGVFWIYADRRLQRAPTITAIRAALGFADLPFLVKSDAHYR